MATFRKVKTGWQAQVARRGVRRAKTLPTKSEAKDWAARQEYLILAGEGEHGPGTIGDLFKRYARDVSPGKRGARWEQIRLERLRRDRLAKIDIRKVRPGDFADWRDRRLREVAPGTVRREMVLLSSVLSVARREWGVLTVNPMRDVSKPASPAARDRRVSDREVAALEAAARSEIERRAVQAFRFAIETGMRAGEITSLTVIKGRVAHLTETKNGTARDVPLSSRALDLWPERGFGLTARQLDTVFRRVRDRAGIDGLTFHDSRHEAITRMSRKLDVLALARVVGHRDIRMLQTYYNESAEDLADRLG